MSARDYLDWETRKKLDAEDREADARHRSRQIETILGTIETNADDHLAERLSNLYDLKSSTLEKAHYEESHLPSGKTSEHATMPRASLEQRITECATSYAAFEGENGIEVHALRCKARACPYCRLAEAARWRSKLDPLIALYSAPKMITLTILDRDRPLHESIKHLYDSWRRLRQQKWFSRRPIFGYAFLEVKVSDTTGLYHPHLHIICNTAFIPNALLVEGWTQATGDSWNAEIRAIRNFDLKYVTKYVHKTSNIWTQPVTLWSVQQELKGIRLINAFGKFPAHFVPPSSPLLYLGTISYITRRALDGDVDMQGVWLSIYTKYPQELKASILHPPPQHLR